MRKNETTVKNNSSIFALNVKVDCLSQEGAVRGNLIVKGVPPYMLAALDMGKERLNEEYRVLVNPTTKVEEGKIAFQANCKGQEQVSRQIVKECPQLLVAAQLRNGGHINSGRTRN